MCVALLEAGAVVNHQESHGAGLYRARWRRGAQLRRREKNGTFAAHLRPTTLPKLASLRDAPCRNPNRTFSPADSPPAPPTGFTALHFAVASGFVTLVRALLHAGANPDILTFAGAAGIRESRVGD